jgi:predicted ribosome quality control (RQC) complex YloA/Tae2 family protein
MPRRLKTREGWDVMIGRSNEGNDYLTHQLARPEDYWFHVHGAAGSHVVLRRGKGKNEPSRQTIEEVAAWAAFYSQARTAGKVSVIVTRKKYVRKPKKAPPGLAMCEREKTVMVRPREPEKDAMADSEGEGRG